MIETEIKELTASIKELTATLSARSSAKTEEDKETAHMVNTVAKQHLQNTMYEPSKTKTPKKEAKTHPPKAEEPEVEDDILTFDEIASRFKVLVAKGGREPAIEILKNFEIKGKLTADQLPAEKYREFLDAIDAVDLEALV